MDCSLLLLASMINYGLHALPLCQFAGVHEYPFLHARAFAAVASFSSVVYVIISTFYSYFHENITSLIVRNAQINQRICEQFTCAAIQALASDV